LDELTSFHEGHLLETGVYREDLSYHFKVDPATVQKLINSIDKDLTFALEVECGIDRSTIANYDQVRGEIIEKLEMLRDSPERFEQPLIYHLDVAAMYPNIILTNRLQPSSMVTQQDCAGCDFNVKGSNCQRPMEWVWRGDYNPASYSEYTMIKTQLMYEQVDGKAFTDLNEAEQAKRIKDRLKSYSQKVSFFITYICIGSKCYFFSLSSYFFLHLKYSWHTLKYNNNNNNRCIRRPRPPSSKCERMWCACVSNLST
jgi:DNA polymerase epsilon subunit 1